MNLYTPIEEFDNRLGIAADGTCWDFVRDCPKSTYQARADRPHSLRVEATINGKAKALAIGSLLKTYHPLSPVLEHWELSNKIAREVRVAKNAEAVDAKTQARLLKKALNTYRASKSRAANFNDLPTDLADGELLKPIAGHPGYSITTAGRVWSHPKRVPATFEDGWPTGYQFRQGKWLEYCTNNVGTDPAKPRWARVRIRGEAGQRKHSVARLMWETFVGPIPDGKVMECINHDYLDLRLENLQYRQKGGFTIEDVSARTVC